MGESLLNVTVEAVLYGLNVIFEPNTVSIKLNAYDICLNDPDIFVLLFESSSFLNDDNLLFSLTLISNVVSSYFNYFKFDV